MTKRAAIVLLGLTLIACGGSKGGKPGTAKTTAPPPPPRSSLTGLIVGDPSVLKRCVLAIKVENSTAARPQSGLQDADVVYEEIAEGGITRFIAMYQSNGSNNVGPVRSARLVDPNILKLFNAWLVYSGAHPVVEAAVEHSGIRLLEYNSYPSAFRRSSARPAPHNLYTNTPALWKIATKCSTPPNNIFRFQEQPPVLPPSPSPGATASPPPSAVSKGSSMKIVFSEVQTTIWRYDGTKDDYLRWNGSAPALLDSGAQMAARNVVVMVVKVKPGGYLDPAGNPAYEVVVTGSGKLTLYRNGLKVSGTWSRTTANDQMTMTDSTGQPMQLAPGVTWIELVPDTSTIS